VQSAVNKQGDFVKFRRCHEYRQILEHVSVELGSQYLDAIKSFGFSDGELKKKIDTMRAFNRIGGAEKFHYKNLGWLAPSLLRYLKVDAEIESLFGHLNNYKVCEIGGGFGGQYYVSSRLHKFQSWTIFDLPQVLQLQRKFLESCGDVRPGEVIFKSGIEILPEFGDLLISNYAFSELAREVQEKYADWIFNNFSSGYITWNTLSESKLGGFKLNELLESHNQLQVLEETPLTAPGNQILYWSSK
jgi:hypothetical protein